jgi:hypothetical protein
VIYGYVAYRDSFGEDHEHRICSYFAVYCMDFRIKIDAPAEYHRCT